MTPRWTVARQIGAATAIILVSYALLAPWLSTWSTQAVDWDFAYQAPGSNRGHWLGTDAIGRDWYALTAAALRSALLLAASAALLAVALGALLGALAALLGGWFDRLMVRILAIVQSLPLVLIVILLLSLWEASTLALLLVIAVYASLDVLRIVRARAIELIAQPFMTHAALLGLSWPRLLWRHLLPNLRPTLATALLIAIPQAILIESYLGFLGLSPMGQQSSLGALLAEGMLDVQLAPWLVLTPALLLFALLLAIFLLVESDHG